MLKYRLVTGPILIAALLGLIFLDEWVDGRRLTGFWRDLFLGRDYPPRGLVLFLLGLLIAPLAGLELSRIFEANRLPNRPWLTSLAAMLGLVLSYSVPIDTTAIPAIGIVATGMMLVFVASLLTFSRHRNVEGVVAGAGGVVFAMVYLGFMFGFLLALRREHSAWWIVGIILITKSCDTGAYFTGRAIGRRKLIPWLSPGKTWEGLAGGVALAMLVGLLVALASSWFPDVRPLGGPALTIKQVQMSPWVGLLCGLIFGVVGQLGDLTMSLFKRGAGIKDSSQILPGLGGVLDVLDSPLMVAPVAFWVLEIAA